MLLDFYSIEFLSQTTKRAKTMFKARMTAQKIQAP